MQSGLSLTMQLQDVEEEVYTEEFVRHDEENVAYNKDVEEAVVRQRRHNQ